MAFSPLYLGTNHMLGVDNYVPITTNNFEIRIYNMDGSSPTDNADLLTLSTDQAGEITEQQDAIVVHYGNGLIKFPSKVTYGDVSWTVNCYCDPDVGAAMKEWRNQIYDPQTEKMGLPSEYMRQVYFIRFDGQGNARSALRCPGTWISGLQYGQYNQQGGSVVQLTTTFQISKAIYLGPDDLN